ncbi:MAG: nitroreductase [Cytophagales bacterium]|nr:MAG: nitroreductase [Cytophagales bacterium]
MPYLDFNVEEIDRLMRSRRSIFPQHFGKELIPDKVIAELLENARWAPTHGLTQPWFFMVFGGEGKTRLGSLLAEIYRQITPEQDFKASKYQKHIDRAAQSSHVIALCMRRTPNTKIPEVEEVEAVACAAQNIYLSLTARGLGGYWSSGGVVYSDVLKEEFGLGAQDKILGLFYVGVPLPTHEAVSYREPLDGKVQWILE